MGTKALPDWAAAATVVLEAALSELVVVLLLQEVEQKQHLLGPRRLCPELTQAQT